MPWLRSTKVWELTHRPYSPSESVSLLIRQAGKELGDIGVPAELRHPLGA